MQWILICLLSISIACHQTSHQQNLSDADKTTEKGKFLAEIHCASCHRFPEPSLLSKNAWQNKALPYMGLRLGFHSPQADSLVSKDQLVDTTTYPSRKLITDEEWNDIIHYYTSVAPDVILPQPKHEPAIENAHLFRADFINAANQKPAVCFVRIDTLQNPHQIVFADAFKKIFRISNDYKLIDFLEVPGPIIDMAWTGANKLYTNIGSIDPVTQKAGSVGTFVAGADSRPVYKILFDTLARPVETIPCDLNNDGKTDYIICEFGVDKGTVSWMENTGNNCVKRLLVNKPGSVKADVKDVNNDGLQDIFVLMSQGDECMYLLTNKGHGNFDVKQVLHFPPVYGSVSFELDDFNKDGYADILYACGDNADATQVLKPYHGIYIFMNDKTNHFSQSYFYPMYGCYKAMAADFNNDGNLDIAAIAFFADYVNHPQDGFVYLQNSGNNNFKPYSISETTKGRWLCMDVGDIDGDNKPDIILGNMAASVEKNNNRWAQAAPLLVLKNIMQ